MTELERRLKDALDDFRKLEPDAEAATQRFHSKLRRRNATLGVLGPLCLCVLLGAGALVFNQHREDSPEFRREELWASPARFLSSSAAKMNSTELLGQALDPERLPDLPSEGLVVEVVEKGTMLLDLGGKVLGNLPGYSLWSNEDVPGPQLLRGPLGDFLIDPPAGRLRRFNNSDLQFRWPLSYGAHLQKDTVNDPDTYQVVRDRKVLLDVGNRMTNDLWVSNDRDIVTFVSYLPDESEQTKPGLPSDSNPGTAIDLRTNKLRTLPPGCFVADRHGKAWVLICGSPGPSTKEKNGRRPFVQMLRPDGSVRRLFGPPKTPSGGDAGGSWRKLAIAPDGKTLLGQWSGECEVQTPHLGYIWDKALPSVGQVLGSKAERGPDGEALGWTLQGDAVVFLPGGLACGSPYEKPGIYLISTDRRIKLLLGLAPEVQAGQVALWAPVLK